METKAPKRADFIPEPSPSDSVIQLLTAIRDELQALNANILEVREKLTARGLIGGMFHKG